MPKKEQVREDEIDLVELIKIVWGQRSSIIKITSIFLVVGIVVAFTSKVEYEATCKLMPENQEGGTPNLAGLGGLAGLAGININLGGAGSLTPELYPEIVKSVPFLNDLVNKEVYFEHEDTLISSFQYFKEIDSPSLIGLVGKYTIGLPGILSQLFSDENQNYMASDTLLRFSKKDWKLMEDYSRRLQVSVNINTGVISINVEMPDPVASAQTAFLLVDQLTSKIVEYRIEKVKANLNFIEERYKEAKENYEEKQEQLAKYTDRNRNVSNSLVQTENERIQHELSIMFEVYKGLASQLEQAKIKVEEETPVFTVLEPVRVPEDKSKPQRVVILVLVTFLGFIFSCTITLVRNRYSLFS